MSRDDFDALPDRGGEDLGCEAFGHLASPFVDRELPGSELERFETHLGGCQPCRRLLDEYRALDALAGPPLPAVADADWARAWSRIEETIVADRAAAEAEPLAPVFRAAERLRRKPLPRALRPLLYLAASLAIVAVLFQVQREATAPKPEAPQVAALSELECAGPDYVPVSYNIGDGDDAVSVMYCAFIGVEG